MIVSRRAPALKSALGRPLQSRYGTTTNLCRSGGKSSTSRVANFNRRRFAAAACRASGIFQPCCRRRAAARSATSRSITINGNRSRNRRGRRRRRGSKPASTSARVIAEIATRPRVRARKSVAAAMPLK